MQATGGVLVNDEPATGEMAVGRRGLTRRFGRLFRRPLGPVLV